jgi:hypothetical protein
MPRRHILSARQRSALLDLPSDEASLLRHYILAEDDLIGSVANMGHGRAASPSWGIRQHWRNAY